MEEPHIWQIMSPQKTFTLQLKVQDPNTGQDYTYDITYKVGNYIWHHKPFEQYISETEVEKQQWINNTFHSLMMKVYQDGLFDDGLPANNTKFTCYVHKPFFLDLDGVYKHHIVFELYTAQREFVIQDKYAQ